MRAAPIKFLFDHDFAAVGDGRASIKLTEHAVKLKEAEAAGYDRGFADGQAETKAEAERRAAAALERIAATLENLDRGLSAVEAKVNRSGCSRSGGRHEARAGADDARTVRRSLGAGNQLLSSTGGDS